MFYTANTQTESTETLLQRVAGVQSDWLLNKNDGDFALVWNLAIDCDGTHKVFYEVWNGDEQASTYYDTVAEAIDYFMTLPGELD